MDCFGQSWTQLAGVAVRGLYYPINYLRQFTHSVFWGQQKPRFNYGQGWVWRALGARWGSTHCSSCHLLSTEYNSQCSHAAGGKWEKKKKTHSAGCSWNTIHEWNNQQTKGRCVLSGNFTTPLHVGGVYLWTITWLTDMFETIRITSVSCVCCFFFCRLFVYMEKIH